MDVQQFPASSRVEILMGGAWDGPFTVTGQTGRTPEHLVLTGPSGTFEHCADEFNTRLVKPRTTPAARFPEPPDSYYEPEQPTWEKPCERCHRTISRWRGMSDVSCECGAEYNAGGQRLRDDWRGNPSTWDDDVSDLDGYETQHAGD